MSVKSLSQQGIDSFVVRRTLLPTVAGGGGATTGGMIVMFTRAFSSTVYAGGGVKNGKLFFASSDSSASYRLNSTLINAAGDTVLWHNRRDNLPSISYYYKQGKGNGNTAVTNDVFWWGCGVVTSLSSDYCYYISGVTETGGSSYANEGGYLQNSQDNTFVANISPVPGTNDVYMGGHAYLPSRSGLQPPYLAKFVNGSLSWIALNDSGSTNSYANAHIAAGRPGGGAILFGSMSWAGDNYYYPVISGFNSSGSATNYLRFYLSSETGTYYNIGDVATDGTYDYVSYIVSNKFFVSKFNGNTHQWTKQIDLAGTGNISMVYDNGKLYITTNQKEIVALNTSDGSLHYSRKMLSNMTLWDMKIEGDWMYLFGTVNTSSSGYAAVVSVKIPKDGSQLGGPYYVDGSPYVFVTGDNTVTANTSFTTASFGNWTTTSRYTISGYQSTNIFYDGTFIANEGI